MNLAVAFIDIRLPPEKGHSPERVLATASDVF